LTVASLHHLAPSLYLLRLPSALAAAATVVVTAATAREAGGGTRAQTIAAFVSAVSAISLATGHFVTTTTFDVLSTALLGWLLVRAVMRRDPRPLLWAGVVVGVGVEAKPQVGFVAFVALIAVAVAGPRWILASKHLWIGIVLALALATPYLIWQQRHGWPQLEVAAAIGGSAEGGRLGFLPFQLVMVSPFLVPVWIAGLVVPWRNPALRPVRFVTVLFVLLAAAYIAGDGKAYYLASAYPTLIGLGAVPTAAWLTSRTRWVLLVTAVALSATVNAAVALPLLPEQKLPGSVTVALNPDLANTVGWPDYVDTVSRVWHSLPPDTQAHAAIVTGTYSEAAAIDVLGGRAGLPSAFSGHNGFGMWGYPRPDQTMTILIGYDAPHWVGTMFTGCRVAARIGNRVGLANGEYGQPVMVCTGLVTSWERTWPRLRWYG
jgi:4-amino-4-deoxy-L-arabinose transferase-like glycosyltransferase